MNKKRLIVGVVWFLAALALRGVIEAHQMQVVAWMGGLHPYLYTVIRESVIAFVLGEHFGPLLIALAFTERKNRS